MKPAGLILLVPAGLMLTSWAAETDPKPAVAAAPTLSAHLKEVIRASLPVYTPPAPPVVSSAPPPSDADPDILVLPKVVVQEKRLPGHDPDLWLSERVVQQKAMSAYRDSMTGFEWALNSWFIPLFSAPPSVRARAAYESGKTAAEASRLNNIIRTIGITDPKTSAELKKAMTDARRAEDWQDRTTGGK